MKLKPLHIVMPVFLIGFLVSMQGYAQEDRVQTDMELNKDYKVDPQPPTEGSEARPNVKPLTSAPVVVTTSAKDTTQSKPSIKPVKTADKNQKNNDPLSFNFLYYLIEKFKMSDLIE